MRTLPAILLGMIPAVAWSLIFRVPSEYATIQSAYDTAGAWDTIFVAPGTYAEELQLNSHTFVLLGDVQPDTGDYPKPVIDPSTLTNPHLRRCIILTRSGVICDFGFRNGASMYAGRPNSTVGGIYDASSVPLNLVRCDFDSVYGGLGHAAGNAVLANCRFRYSAFGCVRAGLGRIEAYDCLFDGNISYDVIAMSVSCGNGSVIRNCTFQGNAGGSNMISCLGDQTEISGCTFGPSGGPMIYHPVEIGNARDLIFRGNTFVDLQSFTSQNVIVTIGATCDSPITVDSNDFHSNSSFGAFWIPCPYDEQNNPTRGYAGTIEHNTITNSFAGSTSGIALSGHADLTRNRFEQLTGLATVGSHFDSGSIMRDNYFSETGMAVQATEPLDARWNWWGDSTGPYHPQLNPGGQGDVVGDNVTFNPWYTDTTFLPVAEPRSLPPQEFRLVVYPNPFNVATTISFLLPQTQNMKLVIYDLAGRRAGVLAEGMRPAGEHVIKFDGTALASGIYFARLIAGEHHITQKLLLIK